MILLSGLSGYRKAYTLLLHREGERMYGLFEDGMRTHLQEVSSQNGGEGSALCVFEMKTLL